jgi:ribosomal protein L11 methyltransferase
VPQAAAEELRARFLELAPEGFEESETPGTVELAGYGPAAERIVAAFPGASVTEVADGWETRWREFHHAIRIGPLWVGPPWEVPDDGSAAVVIDPGQAFGTGAHATTRLCLELLLDRPRGSVLDLGCGSGVLAIAAARLGFAPVIALDLDPIAVEVTKENARANGVEIEVREADAREGGFPATGLAVANIALAAVQALAPRLAAQTVITSGYLASDRLELPGLVHVERRELAGWAADLFERRRPDEAARAG